MYCYFPSLPCNSAESSHDSHCRILFLMAHPLLRRLSPRMIRKSSTRGLLRSISSLAKARSTSWVRESASSQDFCLARLLSGSRLRCWDERLTTWTKVTMKTTVLSRIRTRLLVAKTVRITMRLRRLLDLQAHVLAHATIIRSDGKAT